ncbi:MAG: ABC transporter ATP-binding protein [Flavobacteriales bacterium]|nr:ABC transporter ATP-binding protein [Flavobacteriales bacterium]
MRTVTLHAEALVIGHHGRPLRPAFDLQLRPGRVTALLGNNGSGKTTLLRTLSGLLAPLSGRVLLDGREVQGMAERERARQLAVVMAHRPRAGLMRAEDVVRLGRLPWSAGWFRSDPDDAARVQQAMEQTRTLTMVGRAFNELSDGEAQRVLIARALAQDAPVLLLDEPTAYLDVSQRAALMQLLRTIARERALTVLMATHDLQQALDSADEVFILGPDGAHFHGAPGDAVQSGAIASAFAVDGLRFDPAQRVFRPVE